MSSVTSYERTPLFSCLHESYHFIRPVDPVERSHQSLFLLGNSNRSLSHMPATLALLACDNIPPVSGYILNTISSNTIFWHHNDLCTFCLSSRGWPLLRPSAPGRSSAHLSARASTRPSAQASARPIVRSSARPPVDHQIHQAPLFLRASPHTHHMP